MKLNPLCQTDFQIKNQKTERDKIMKEKNLFKYFFNCILTMGALLLTGCATKEIQKYSISSNVPFAYLKSEITGAYDSNEYIGVYIKDGRSPSYKEETMLGMNVRDVRFPAPNEDLLFSIKKNVVTPSGYIRVPAGEQVFIRYNEISSASRICFVTATAFFEPGKKYSLTGGFKYEKGPIPILTDIRKCSMGILDEDSKSYIKIEPDSTPNSNGEKYGTMKNIF
jgi:hypothetical protein